MQRGKKKSFKKAFQAAEDREWAASLEELNHVMTLIEICANCGDIRMHHLDETKCLFNSTEFKNSP